MSQHVLLSYDDCFFCIPGITPKLRGAVSHSEGPMMKSLGPSTSLGPGTSFYSPAGSLLQQPTSVSQRQYDEGQIELMSTEMSVSALYMHDLRTRRLRGHPFENMDDIRARSLWQRHDSAQTTPTSGGATLMPEIEEQPQEEETTASHD